MASSRTRIEERRLKPVLDALEEGRNAAALREANALLKKDSSLVRAKVAKAMALCRLDRDEEAQPLIDELKENITSYDDFDVQSVSVLLHEVGRHREMIDICHALAAANPTDEEHQVKYFMSLIRARKYADLQKAALSLCKLSPDGPYYFWSVMALLLQVSQMKAQGEDETKANMLLVLAERKMQKAVTDKILKSGEAFRLYLLVLEALHKPEAALQLLEQDAAKAFGESSFVPSGMERQELLIKYNKELEKWPEVKKESQMLLKTNPDHWAAYLSYIDAVLRISEGDGVDGHAELSEAREFIGQLAEEQSKTAKPLRGPYLGLLELASRKAQFQDEDPVTQERVTTLLKQYFERFGSKPCYFADVRPYLHLLPNEAETLTAFVQELRTITEKMEEPEHKRVLRLAAIEKVARFLGLHHTPNDSDRSSPEVAFEKCQAAFEKAKHLGEGLKDSEHRFNDSFAVLAAHAAFEAFEQRGDKSFIIKALALLEEASSMSQANPQLRLLAVKLYCALGAVHAAIPHWAELEVKQIQHDSIGYILYDHLFYQGAPDSSASVCAVALHFYRSGINESPEFMCHSFKYGSFHKIEEFDRFQTKLSRSMQLALLRAEHAHVALFQSRKLEDAVPHLKVASKYLPNVDKLANLRLFDNRDLVAMDAFQPPALDMLQSNARDIEVAAAGHLAIRCGALRAISSAIKHASAVFECDREQGPAAAKAMESAAATFKEILYNQPTPTRPPFPARTCFQFGICLPRVVYSTADGAKVFSLGLSFIAKAFVMLSNNLKGKELAEAIEELRNKLDSVKLACSETMEFFAIFSEAISQGLTTATDMEKAFFYIEAFVHIGLLILAGRQAAQVVPQGSQGPAQNKGFRQASKAFLPMLDELQSHVKSCAAKASEHLKSASVANAAGKLERLTLDSQGKSTAHNVVDAINESYEKSLKAFADMLKNPLI